MSLFTFLHFPHKVVQILSLPSGFPDLLFKRVCVSVCACSCLCRRKSQEKWQRSLYSRESCYKKFLQKSHTLLIVSHSIFLTSILLLYPNFRKIHNVINMTPMDLIKVAPQRTLSLREWTISVCWKVLMCNNYRNFPLQIVIITWEALEMESYGLSAFLL